MSYYLQTGQNHCYDDAGQPMPCRGSGQDACFRKGRTWPSPRFLVEGDQVKDPLTGLVWGRDANPSGFPLTWQEALSICASLGAAWRLPNINELESLVDCGRFRPALPEGLAPGQLFPGYWSSTTSLYEQDWAWALYAEDGGIGVGQKAGRHFHVWAVSDGDV